MNKYYTLIRRKILSLWESYIGIQSNKQRDTHIAEMAIQLWSSHTVDELEKEFANLLNDGRTAFFVKFVNNVPVGFAQCSLRNEYVEGTSSSPVGYLE